MLATWFLLSVLSLARVEAMCTRTRSRKEYPLVIGVLKANINDYKTQHIIEEEMVFLSREVLLCFQTPTYLSLVVNDTLKLPQHGWTQIESSINDALPVNSSEKGALPAIVIGPFYVNVAMMLQRMGIPYLITDYKGFDWIDMNRVQDEIDWKTMVEVRPCVRAQNLAVVDLFVHRNWKSAMMVMPESAADNQECLNLAEQMLNQSLSVIPYTVDPRDPALGASLRELLSNAKLFLQTQILVCSPRDTKDKLIEAILTYARLFGILRDKEFSFIFVDSSSSLAPISEAGNMYRLGLFSALCELLAFRYIAPSKDDKGPPNEDAAVSDAAKVLALALNKYILSQKVMTDEYSPERFLQALKEVKLPESRTGNLEFDEHGRRTNYTLDLYKHGGEDMYKLVAKWNPDFPTTETRLNITANASIDESLDYMGIFPDLVKIVVVEERPFVMPRSDTTGSLDKGDNQYEGFTIDLIKQLAHELSFKYKIYKSPNNRYGLNYSDGSWDGMVGEILSGRATLACGSISITSSREAVIDFSLGVLSTGVNLLVKKPDESLTIFQFMMPFSLELWMAIVGATTTVSLVFFAMDYCSEDRRFTVRETIWFTVGTLLKRGSDFAPVPVSQRILTAGFLFFVLITVSTYTANMAAFLTTKNFGETIDSFESLSKADYIGVSTVNNSATMDFLKKATKPVYGSLWRKAENSKGLVEDATMGLQLVKNGGHAFIYDYLINEAAEKMNCDVMTVAPPILLQEHGIGMKAGAAFKSSINIELLKMKESGFIAKLKKKWWDDKRSCDLGSDSQRTGQVQFGLSHTAGVFIVGLFGVCVSALLFLGKRIYFLILGACQRRKKNKENKRKTEFGHDNNANDEARKERHRLYQGTLGKAV